MTQPDPEQASDAVSQNVQLAKSYINYWLVYLIKSKRAKGSGEVWNTKQSQILTEIREYLRQMLLPDNFRDYLEGEKSFNAHTKMVIQSAYIRMSRRVGLFIGNIFIATKNEYDGALLTMESPDLVIYTKIMLPELCDLYVENCRATNFWYNSMEQFQTIFINTLTRNSDYLEIFHYQFEEGLRLMNPAEKQSFLDVIQNCKDHPTASVPNKIYDIYWALVPDHVKLLIPAEIGRRYLDSTSITGAVDSTSIASSIISNPIAIGGQLPNTSTSTSTSSFIPPSSSSAPITTQQNFFTQTKAPMSTNPTEQYLRSLPPNRSKFDPTPVEDREFTLVEPTYGNIFRPVPADPTKKPRVNVWGEERSAAPGWKNFMDIKRGDEKGGRYLDRQILHRYKTEGTEQKSLAKIAGQKLKLNEEYKPAKKEPRDDTEAQHILEMIRDIVAGKDRDFKQNKALLTRESATEWLKAKGMYDDERQWRAEWADVDGDGTYDDVEIRDNKGKLYAVNGYNVTGPSRTENWQGYLERYPRAEMRRENPYGVYMDGKEKKVVWYAVWGKYIHQILKDNNINADAYGMNKKSFNSIVKKAIGYMWRELFVRDALKQDDSWEEIDPQGTYDLKADPDNHLKKPGVSKIIQARIKMTISEGGGPEFLAAKAKSAFLPRQGEETTLAQDAFQKSAEEFTIHQSTVDTETDSWVNSEQWKAHFAEPEINRYKEKLGPFTPLGPRPPRPIPTINWNSKNMNFYDPNSTSTSSSTMTQVPLTAEKASPTKQQFVDTRPGYSAEDVARARMEAERAAAAQYGGQPYTAQ